MSTRSPLPEPLTALRPAQAVAALLYADALAEVMTDLFRASPHLLGTATCRADLHDIYDANEDLLAVDDRLRIPTHMRNTSWHTEVVNAAESLVDLSWRWSL